MFRASHQLLKDSRRGVSQRSSQCQTAHHERNSVILFHGSSGLPEMLQSCLIRNYPHGREAFVRVRGLQGFRVAFSQASMPGFSGSPSRRQCAPKTMPRNCLKNSTKILGWKMDTDFGPSLVRLLVYLCPSLVRLLAVFGPFWSVIFHLWSVFGPSLVRLWSVFGPSLVRHVPCLVRLFFSSVSVHFWARAVFGPSLVRHFSCLVRHVSCLVRHFPCLVRHFPVWSVIFPVWSVMFPVWSVIFLFGPCLVRHFLCLVRVWSVTFRFCFLCLVRPWWADFLVFGPSLVRLRPVRLWSVSGPVERVAGVRKFVILFHSRGLCLGCHKVPTSS